MFKEIFKLLEFINENLNSIVRNQAMLYQKLMDIEDRLNQIRKEE